MQTGYHTDIPVPGTEANAEGDSGNGITPETASYYFNGNGIRQAGWFRFTENKVYVWRYFGRDGRECDVQTVQEESPEGKIIRNYRWYQVEDH